MSPPIVIMLVVFAIASISGVGGWVFGVIELFGILLFKEWAFKTGPAILKATIADETLGMGSTKIGKHVVGRAVASGLPDGRILIRASMGGQAVALPFPVKGTIEMDGSEIKVVGRLALGPLVFLAGWFLVWETISIMQVISGDLRSGFAGLISGCFFMAGILVVFVPIQSSRFRTAFADYRSAHQSENDS
jgi:hypothetical protein